MGCSARVRASGVQCQLGQCVQHQPGRGSGDPSAAQERRQKQRTDHSRKGAGPPLSTQSSHPSKPLGAPGFEVPRLSHSKEQHPAVSCDLHRGKEPWSGAGAAQPGPA